MAIWFDIPANDWVGLQRHLRRVVADLTASISGGGGVTDLTYTAATRIVASSTGADATLSLVSSSNAGLAPATGGGTTNFLRADGSWAAPPGGGGGSGSTYFPSGW
jgi:hypothetical protein